MMGKPMASLAPELGSADTKSSPKVVNMHDRRELQKGVHTEHQNFFY